MATLSDYSLVNGLPTPAKYINALYLAANVPDSFTVPTDDSGIKARFVTFGKTKLTDVDFYARVFNAADSADRAVNGTFTTDTDWTKGAGWTIAAGVATATGAISTALSQTATTIPLIEGQAYYVTYTATRSAGSVTINIGGTAGTARSTAATFAEIIIAGSTQEISFSTSGFTGTVDALTIIPCAYEAVTDITTGTSSDLNPVGYFLNSDASRISIVSGDTSTVTANFYK